MAMLTEHKTSLSPMVRLGTLPLRLLSLERGASLVYTEELPAHKLSLSVRHWNARLGTYDWSLPRKPRKVCSSSSAMLQDPPPPPCILRTCRAEAGRLVVQLGVANVDEAIAAADALFAGDPSESVDAYTSNFGIAAVDVNMGCPQRAALDGGCGVALFADSTRAEAVVRALRRSVPIAVAVTCKIRLDDSGPEACAIRCLGLVRAGASGLALHARRPADRCHTDLARWAEVADVVRRLDKSGLRWIMVNGDALDAASAAALREASGCSHVLVGRGALLPGPVFLPLQGAPAPTLDVIGSKRAGLVDETPNFRAREAEGDRERGHEGTFGEDVLQAALSLCRRYAQLAVDTENNPENTAFVLQWMLHAAQREVSFSRRWQGSSQSSTLTAVGTCCTGDDSMRSSDAGIFVSDVENELLSTCWRLRAAKGLEAVAEAVGEGDYCRRVWAEPGRRPQGPLPAPSHRFRSDYFDPPMLELPQSSSHSSLLSGPAFVQCTTGGESWRTMGPPCALISSVRASTQIQNGKKAEGCINGRLDAPAIVIPEDGNAFALIDRESCVVDDVVNTRNCQTGSKMLSNSDFRKFIQGTPTSCYSPVSSTFSSSSSASFTKYSSSSSTASSSSVFKFAEGAVVCSPADSLAARFEAETLATQAVVRRWMQQHNKESIPAGLDMREIFSIDRGANGTVTLDLGSQIDLNPRNGDSGSKHGQIHLYVGHKECLETLCCTRALRKPRYFVLECAEPSAKKLGYFATAWRCRCVVAGKPYDSPRFRRSRRLAEESAAELALQALSTNIETEKCTIRSKAAVFSPNVSKDSFIEISQKETTDTARANSQNLVSSKKRSELFVPRQAQAKKHHSGFP